MWGAYCNHVDAALTNNTACRAKSNSRPPTTPSFIAPRRKYYHFYFPLRHNCLSGFSIMLTPFIDVVFMTNTPTQFVQILTHPRIPQLPRLSPHIPVTLQAFQPQRMGQISSPAFHPLNPVHDRTSTLTPIRHLIKPLLQPIPTHLLKPLTPTPTRAQL